MKNFFVQAKRSRRSVSCADNMNAQEVEKTLSLLTFVYRSITPKYRSIVLILAYDTNDAINLARFLSKNNRIMPEKNRSLLDDKSKEFYDLLLENYYEFFNMNTSTAYVVYPGLINVNYNIVSKFIAKMLMDHAFKIKIVLTLRKPQLIDRLYDDYFKETLKNIHQSLEIGVEVIKAISKYQNSIAVVVTNGTFNYIYDQVHDNPGIGYVYDYEDYFSDISRSSNEGQNIRLMAHIITDSRKRIAYIAFYSRQSYDRVHEMINVQTLETAKGEWDFSYKLFDDSDETISGCVNSLKKKSS